MDIFDGVTAIIGPPDAENQRLSGYLTA